MKAFPIHIQDQDRQFAPAVHEGMDLEDYFAAKAMQALIATAGAPCLTGLDGLEPHVAKASYKISREMMKAKEQA